jgi:hypothetical protein
VFKWISCLIVTVSTLLASSGTALAGGGNYTFSGGTEAGRSTVRKALEASAFPWDVVSRL